MTSKSDATAAVWIARAQAGLIAGLLATIFSISHASLVTGAVAPEATAPVIGMALIGSSVLCLALGLFSGVKGVVPIVQDVPSAALGAILVAMVADRAGSAAGVSTAEIVMLCIVAGVVFAVALYAFGSFRLAALMRFAPRPVIAGFLAGTGYFVVSGAVGICVGATLGLSMLPDLFQPPTLWKLLLALAVSLALVVMRRVMPVNLAIACVFGCAIAGFHIVAAMLGADTARLLADGWIMQLPEAGLTWPPVDWATFRETDLRFVMEQALPLSVMVVLATAALLMNTTALEARTRTDLSLDDELKLLGLTNLASAGLGGMPGYHGVSATLSAYKIAAPHRAITLVAGAFVLLIFFLGNAVLALLPLPVLAGFMLWVGGDFLREWLWRELRLTPPGEAWLTLAIFAVIVAFGLFEGTVFGLVAGALLFVVDYSRLDPVRAEFRGDAYHGSGEMSAGELRVLEAHGGEIAIVKLQGFVFFGTAHKLRERLQALDRAGPVTYYVLDFEAVTGLDATAVSSFRRIGDDLVRNGQHAVLTALSPQVAGIFLRAGLEIGGASGFQIADDMDSGLSGFEARLLAEHLPDGPGGAGNIVDVLSGILGDRDDARKLAGYLERVAPAPGEAFIREGSSASDLYFLERGSAEVLVGEAGARRRLRRLGPGAMIGEIAFYGGGVRSSTVVAGDGTELWRLSSELAARVLAEDPRLSSRFHAGLAARLAARVDANTRLIRTLRA